MTSCIIISASWASFPFSAKWSFSGCIMFFSISYDGFAVCATEGGANHKVRLTLPLEWRMKIPQACTHTDLVFWDTQSLLLIDWLQTVHQLFWATNLKKYSKCFPGISSLTFFLFWGKKKKKLLTQVSEMDLGRMK